MGEPFKKSSRTGFLDDATSARLSATRKDWEKSTYHEQPFYKNIHQVTGIGGAATVATDWNRHLVMSLKTKRRSAAAASPRGW